MGSTRNANMADIERVKSAGINTIKGGQELDQQFQKSFDKHLKLVRFKSNLMNGQIKQLRRVSEIYSVAPIIRDFRCCNAACIRCFGYLKPIEGFKRIARKINH